MQKNIVFSVALYATLGGNFLALSPAFAMKNDGPYQDVFDATLGQLRK